MATPGRPLSEAERRKIVGLRAAGLSLRAIAATAGVAVNTVRKYVDGGITERRLLGSG